MKTKILICFAFLVLLANQLAYAHTPITATQSFITVADIHFDPFSDCTTYLQTCPLITELRAADYQRWDAIFAKYDHGHVASKGEDTNYHLLKLALAELKIVKQNSSPQFGFILGDFLAHDFPLKYKQYSHDFSKKSYQQFVLKTLQYMTLQLQTVFQTIDMYPAVGNNDSYTGDYSDVPNGEFFQQTANTWAHFIQNKENRASFQKTFPQAGYYAVMLNEHQRAIILNTVLFSTHSHHNSAAAQQQLNWLHEQLELAKQHHQEVLLAYHIPIGIDVFRTLQNKMSAVSQFWQEKYMQPFEADIRAHAAQVKIILSAHIHMETFQLLTTNQIGNIPILFTPSISPIFGNNPGFKVFQWDPTDLQIKNYSTYYLPLSSPKKLTWQREYSVN